MKPRPLRLTLRGLTIRQTANPNPPVAALDSRRRPPKAVGGG